MVEAYKLGKASGMKSGKLQGPKIILLSFKIGAGFDYVLVFIPIMTSTDLFLVGWRNQPVTTLGCAVHLCSAEIWAAIFTYAWQG